MVDLWQVAIVGPKDELLLIEDIVQDFAEPPLSLSLFDDELPNWRLQMVMEGKPQNQWLRAMQVPDGLQIKAQRLQDKNWVTESLRFLTSVRAGRFFIHGSHEVASRNPDDVSICIPAGMAFGTGHHETTSGCLLELDHWLQRGCQTSHVLDLGTGAGILAIAAAKTMTAEILATDIDPEAVKVSIANAQVNEVTSRIKFIEADGVAHSELQSVKFDLIFANILAAPLIEMATGISALLTSGGTLILAGLLTTQAEAVTSAYTHSGLKLTRSQDLGEWSILTMSR